MLQLKKILSAAVCAVLSAASLFAFAACENVCTFSEKFSYDENYHWHECTAVNCNKTTEKQPHVWVKTGSSGNQDTYVCECGLSQSTLTCPFGTVLTADTDFFALKSERVTQEQWKHAFRNNHDKNVTIENKNTYNGLPGNENTASVKMTPGAIALILNGEAFCTLEIEGSKFTMITPNSDGAYDVQSFDYIEQGDIDVGNGKMLKDIAENWYLSYKMACPDFSEYFSEFVYDEERGSYIFDDKEIKTNSTFEYWDTVYNFAEVKIINGELAFIRTGNYSTEGVSVTGNKFLNHHFIKFYDYGTTSVAVPDYKA